MKQLLLNIQKFAKFEVDLESLFKANTKDDVTDFANINKVLNTDIDKYNSSKQPDIEALKTKAIGEYEKTLFTGLGIEGVGNLEQFNKHVGTIKNSTDANADKVTELQGLLDTKTTEFETMETDFTKSKTESAKMAFKLDIIDEDFSSRFENAVKGEFETITKDLKEFDKKDIFKQIGEKFPEYKNDFVSGTENFGNRKPNDKKKNAFGDTKEDKNFFGGRL